MYYFDLDIVWANNVVVKWCWNGVCGRGRRGGRGIGRAGLSGCGGDLEASLPLRPGLHFPREITLPMGDPGRVANLVI
jgi:hypothetical protein